MEIHDHGFWINPTMENHWFDLPVAVFLDQFFKNKTVIDLGCGSGAYTKHLLSKGVYCEGYDGNPDTPALTNGLCDVLDLSKDVQLDKQYDYVLSLEVGEHIPAIYERVFINNIHKLNREGVVLSWAIQGQGGDGHVNERSNDYIRGYFAALGYHNDMEAETVLRSIAETWWFKNTIMVFKK